MGKQKYILKKCRPGNSFNKISRVLEKAGYKIVAHIHDEVVIEAPIGEGSLEEVIDIMCEPEPWNEGLILNAAGFENPYYMKD